jgi:hypothetical protein
VKILFYTDLHAKDQNPRSRTGQYRDDILTKFNEIIDIALEREVDYLVNGADTFDHKSPWRTSMRLLYDMSDILERFPAERHITTIGTHDVPTGQLHKIVQQPLGVLHKAGFITIYGGPYDDVLATEEVLFHFVPASYALDREPSNYAVFRNETRVEEAMSRIRPQMDQQIITVAHGMIVPPGGSFFGDFTPADKIETQAWAVLYGHPHTPDGIFNGGGEKNAAWFVGPGSVARLGSYPYNRTRVPEIVLLNIDNEPVMAQASADPVFDFERIPLKTARPPEQVFAEVIKEEVDENEQQERVNSFVEQLSRSSFATDRWGLEDLTAEVMATEASDHVKRAAVEILNEAS